MAKKTARKTAKKTAAGKSARKTTKKTSAAKKKSTSQGAADLKGPAKGLMGDVQTLMTMMVDHEVTEIDIVDGERKISLKRGSFVAPAAAPAAAPPPPTAPAAPPTAAPAEAPRSEPADVDDGLLTITSPMVGTFYTAPSPDSDPFVQAGGKVNPDTVVCIVEAMKVMNEIKAECSGEIVEICVKNAEPVEFGQVLFRVKP
jgi:acetyl-CoA carboxylase biotin carboxyl carrier protein